MDDIPSYTSSQLCEYCQKIDLEEAFSANPVRIKAGRETKRQRLNENPSEIAWSTELNPMIRGWDQLELDCPLCQFLSNARHYQGWTWKAEKIHKDDRFHLVREETTLFEQFATFRKDKSPVSPTRMLTVRPQSWYKPKTSSNIWTTLPFSIFQPFEHAPRERPHRHRSSLSRLLSLPSRLLKGDNNVLTHHMHIRMLDKESANLAMVQSAIKHCKRSHAAICGYKPKSQSSDFKVVDCTKRTLCFMPFKAEFIALSYVWGGKLEVSMHGNDLVSLPQVIEDALAVTLCLGYRYLWVDACCIDQNDEKNKHAQIQAMNTIYKGAALVIIAAAGKDANYGLPGISCPRGSITQISIRINGINIVAGNSVRTELIENSSWNTRAWTYQEGLLSRRRLIFTDDQVLFECKTACFSESIYIPPEILEKGLYQGSHYAYKVGTIIDWVLQRQELDMVRAETNDIWDNINTYLTKSLTFESDTLNAMTAIFSENTDIRHICGIPYKIWSPDPQIELARVLLWQHKIGHELKPPRDQRRPCNCDARRLRRARFASWTWAGWHSFKQSPDLKPWSFSRSGLGGYRQTSPLYFPRRCATISIFRHGAFLDFAPTSVSKNSWRDQERYIRVSTEKKLLLRPSMFGQDPFIEHHSHPGQKFDYAHGQRLLVTTRDQHHIYVYLDIEWNSFPEHLVQDPIVAVLLHQTSAWSCSPEWDWHSTSGQRIYCPYSSSQRLYASVYLIVAECRVRREDAPKNVEAIYERIGIGEMYTAGRVEDVPKRGKISKDYCSEKESFQIVIG